MYSKRDTIKNVNVPQNIQGMWGACIDRANCQTSKTLLDPGLFHRSVVNLLQTLAFLASTLYLLTIVQSAVVSKRYSGKLRSSFLLNREANAIALCFKAVVCCIKKLRQQIRIFIRPIVLLSSTNSRFLTRDHQSRKCVI